MKTALLFIAISTFILGYYAEFLAKRVETNTILNGKTMVALIIGQSNGANYWQNEHTHGFMPIVYKLSWIVNIKFVVNQGLHFQMSEESIQSLH